jgi:hypothetical protein
MLAELISPGEAECCDSDQAARGVQLLPELPLRLRVERFSANAPLIARSCAISRGHADLFEYRLDAPAIALRP